MQSQLRDAIDSAPVSPALVLLLITCFLINMVDGYDMLSIGFAASPLSQDWKLPADVLGMVFSAGVLGMTLGAMCLSPLTDTFGRRPVILACIALTGCAMLLTAFATSLWMLLALRLLTGLGIGTILASVTALVSEFFPERLRNFAVSLTLSGYPFGGVLAGFVAAEVIPIHGWRGIFAVGGVASLALLPVIWRALPESTQFLLYKRPANALVRINQILERLRIVPFAELPASPEPKIRSHILKLLQSEHRRDTLLLWSAFFLQFGTLYFLLSWIPKLLVDSGVPERLSIYAGLLFNLGGAVGNILLGWLSVRFGLQRCILVFAWVAALGMIAFSQVSLIATLLLTLTGLIGIFQQGVMAGLYSLASRLYNTGVRTTGVGWGIGFGRFGAVLAPYSVGLLVASGWTIIGLYLVFALPMLLVGWLATRLRPLF